MLFFLQCSLCQYQSDKSSHFKLIFSLFLCCAATPLSKVQGRVEPQETGYPLPNIHSLSACPVNQWFVVVCCLPEMFFFHLLYFGIHRPLLVSLISMLCLLWLTIWKGYCSWLYIVYGLVVVHLCCSLSSGGQFVSLPIISHHLILTFKLIYLNLLQVFIAYIF